VSGIGLEPEFGLNCGLFANCVLQVRDVPVRRSSTRLINSSHRRIMKTLFLSGMPGSVEDNRHGPQTAVVFPRRRNGRGVVGLVVGQNVNNRKSRATAANLVMFGGYTG
jgi:hypothetical protein